MAEGRSYGPGLRLDIQQILLEAQTRWLRPAEICEILQNYQKFYIASEPPNMPPSGSLLLFDRKVLRYFRKDGHNWRKKKDGKTVKEAHEKLKVGSVDVLHCYYAHGEENEKFQRRSYWLLEQDYMHIVLVHYLEVKGTKANVGCTKDEEVTSNFQKDSFLSFSSTTYHNKTLSGNTDSASPTSTLTSLCEDAESEDSHQASSRYHSFNELSQMEDGSVVEKMGHGPLSSYFHHSHLGEHKQTSNPGMDYALNIGDKSRDNGGTIMTKSQKILGSPSWEQASEQCSTGFGNVPSQTLVSAPQPAKTGVIVEQGHAILGQPFTKENSIEQEFRSTPIEANWQIPSEDNPLHSPILPMDQKLSLNSAYDLDTKFLEQQTHDPSFQNASEHFCARPYQQCEDYEQNYQLQLSNAEPGYSMESNSGNGMSVEGNFTVKQQLFSSHKNEEGLKKVDSFSRWISKELGDVEELHLQSVSGISWGTVESGNVADDSSQLQLDTYSLSPSLSQYQFFSIVDFSPNWAYTDSETKVLITGTFLMSQETVAKCEWSCMFGEVEVPAEVLADGVLCCLAPPHIAGRVPFYVTCSNRLACSEVREFEYRVNSDEDMDIYNGQTHEMLLQMRFERLLSMKSDGQLNYLDISVGEMQNIAHKIISLREQDECCKMVKPISGGEFSQYEVKEELLEKLMKEKLYSWLHHIITEDGKGPSILDDEGQGVLHLAAALGYDWAIQPTIVSGVNINFRDVNGWTALHWAAFCGREHTVAALVSLGAAPGALTDPTPKFPLGRTPADLASANGQKGISGFLAESSLTSYLSSLTINDPNQDAASDNSGIKAIQTASERTATPLNDGDVPDLLSLKDSLTAVCNATQAADRIYQVFRMQSFHRKQLDEFDSDGLSDERALSLLTVKSCRSGLADAAAVQIQKKFRGWKKRREFIIIRQRIVKIQAHVRGHQVRKKYRPITWSVGILEKVILRWRRKGNGLRGFRSDALANDISSQVTPAQEDDYDFLKKGRKQTEERYQKALSRVKSMVQYPEARDQYRRLLTVVEGFRKTKDVCNTIANSSEGAANGEEDLVDMETLLDDDTFMCMTFE
ncbi:calmodulin-binding transcription activator 2 [Malania oleifera]|uniref:calmodulin-binding transcription activator 2 n=1 Tax=Malania oleifera TaxID=397392 RepID=UPI0025ADCC47|nr:calmodulin-binding transcription activator 2 [Malania oleifera]